MNRNLNYYIQCVALIGLFSFSSLARDKSLIKRLHDNSGQQETRPAGQTLEAEAIDLAKKAYDKILTDKDFHLKTDLHTPWHMVHGMLAYGEDLPVIDSRTGKKVSAMDWIKEGGMYRGESSFILTEHGFEGRGISTPFQGHLGQFAGYLSEMNIDPNTPIRLRNRMTKQDETRSWHSIIEHLKKTDPVTFSQKTYEESSWALWALANSVKADEEWDTKNPGVKRKLEDLVCIEVRRDLTKEACGGLHSLFAMSKALQKYRALNKPLTGCWLEADEREKFYIDHVKKNQNLPTDGFRKFKLYKKTAPDGSFSSNFLEGPGIGEDWRKQLPGNGHILEWLMLVLPDSELRQPWLQKGVISVARNMLDAKVSDGEIDYYLTGAYPPSEQETAFKRFITLGGYFHAAHGVQMYLKRIGAKK